MTARTSLPGIAFVRVPGQSRLNASRAQNRPIRRLSGSMLPRFQASEVLGGQDGALAVGHDVGDDDGGDDNS